MPRNFGMLKKWHLVWILVGAVSVLALGIIIPRVNLSQRKAEAASVLNFPSDHGQHNNFMAEWWYLNLLTRTTKTDGAYNDEKDLGYVISFSKIAGNKGLLSSRYDNETETFNESTNTGGSLSVSLKDGKYLFVQYSNGPVLATLEEKPPGPDRKKVYRLTGTTAEMGSFNLTLKERVVVASGYNTPLLWGGITGNCRGKISVFGEDDTFYYSIPDLDITGTITDIDGVERNVKTGKAWIDHQWFNSVPPNDWKGHYWTNLHLTHSSNLYDSNPHQAIGFVTQIYDNGPRYTYWVKRNSDGSNECGIGGKLTITNYGSTNYPSYWQVELIKSNNLFLKANGRSFSDNQIFKPPSGPQFFEPASFYTGSVDGKPFTGLGFFETHLNKDGNVDGNVDDNDCLNAGYSCLTISECNTKLGQRKPSLDPACSSQEICCDTNVDYEQCPSNSLFPECSGKQFGTDCALDTVNPGKCQPTNTLYGCGCVVSISSSIADSITLTGDANGDGLVNQQELVPAIAELSRSLNNLVPVAKNHPLDTDGNGYLDSVEYLTPILENWTGSIMITSPVDII